MPGRFNLDMFSLRNGCNCVIGQIRGAEGIYMDGRETDSIFDEAISGGWLDLTFELAERYGFYAGHPRHYPYEYDLLDAEWQRLIAERQAVNA
jgi:hypothetical protein